MIRKLTIQDIYLLKDLPFQHYILFCFESEDSFSGFDFEMNTGFDLKNKKEVILYEHTKSIVPTGVKWAAPKGYYLSIVPRSGISFNTPIVIANAPATIEHSYRGDIGIILKYDNDYGITFEGYKGIKSVEGLLEGIEIPAYTRLAQAIIHRTAIPTIDIEGIYYIINKKIYDLWEDLFPSVRNSNGFGSTGVK
jgi:dUTPase